MRLREQIRETRVHNKLAAMSMRYRTPNLPLEAILRKYDLQASAFYHAASHIDSGVAHAPKWAANDLEKIAENSTARQELLRMDYEFLRWQYDQMKSGKNFTFISGTFQHAQNVEDLIYICLTDGDKRFLGDRKTIVQAFEELRPALSEYFIQTGADRIIFRFNRGKGTGGKSLTIMEFFDRARQRLTDDKSLFELSEKHHLHAWEYITKSYSENPYWSIPEKARGAVYRILSEEMPALGSKSRDKVIEQMRNLPKQKYSYFESLELGVLMNRGFRGMHKGSHLAVLMAFDEQYRMESNDKSLFDWTEPNHLHVWNFKTQAYWKRKKNRQEAVYHMITQHGLAAQNPELKNKLTSYDRRDVIKGIRILKELRPGLKKYFVELGLGGLMAGIGNCPLTILEEFDKAWQEKSGTKTSLFDLNEKRHLHSWDYSTLNSRSTRKIKREIYHLLEEHNPELLDGNRRTIVNGVINLPGSPAEYIRLLGLHRKEGCNTELTGLVLDVINDSYKDRYGKADLFETSSTLHLKFDSIGRLIRRI